MIKIAMLLKVVFLCVAYVSQVSATLTNPLTSVSIPYPRALQYNGLYYVIANSTSGANFFPIYTSKDLQNWELATYAFNSENRPQWSLYLKFPSLQVLPNKQIRLYYYTDHASTRYDSAAVAVATEVLGPYFAISGPIGRSSIDYNQYYPVVGIDDVDDSVYMYWGDTSATNLTIKGVALSQNGLSLKSSSSASVSVISLTAAWEAQYITQPYFFQHNAYYYLFYVGGSATTCNNAAIGVARSSNPLGPFEKNPSNPILANFGSFNSPHSPSVVKDVDGLTDLLIYGAFDVTTGCDTTYLSFKKLMWDISGWPRIVD